VASKSTESKSGLFKKVLLLILIILEIIIVPLGAAYATLFYGSLDGYGVFTKWQSIGTPPVLATKILGLCRGAICVQGRDGKTYTIRSFYCNDSPEKPCWEELSTLTEITPPSYDPCWLWPQFAIDPPPTSAVDQIAERECSSGGVWQTNYALLADGSLSMWTHTLADLEGVKWLLFAFFSGVGTFVINILVLASISYFKRVINFILEK
jgi:hypothetical protein